MTADPETVRREKAQAERIAAELIQTHKSALNRYDELVALTRDAYLLGLSEGLRATDAAIGRCEHGALVGYCTHEDCAAVRA